VFVREFLSPGHDAGTRKQCWPASSKEGRGDAVVMHETAVWECQDQSRTVTGQPRYKYAGDFDDPIQWQRARGSWRLCGRPLLLLLPSSADQNVHRRAIKSQRYTFVFRVKKKKKKKKLSLPPSLVARDFSPDVFVLARAPHENFINTRGRASTSARCAVCTRAPSWGLHCIFFFFSFFLERVRERAH